MLNKLVFFVCSKPQMGKVLRKRKNKKRGSKTRINKLAKLRRHASRVHFALIHFG